MHLFTGAATKMKPMHEKLTHASSQAATLSLSKDVFKKEVSTQNLSVKINAKLIFKTKKKIFFFTYA
jgi:hypothetical protein